MIALRCWATIWSGLCVGRTAAELSRLGEADTASPAFCAERCRPLFLSVFANDAVGSFI